MRFFFLYVVRLRRENATTSHALAHTHPAQIPARSVSSSPEVSSGSSWLPSTGRETRDSVPATCLGTSSLDLTPRTPQQNDASSDVDMSPPLALSSSRPRTSADVKASSCGEKNRSKDSQKSSQNDESKSSASSTAKRGKKRIASEVSDSLSTQLPVSSSEKSGTRRSPPKRARRAAPKQKSKLKPHLIPKKTKSGKTLRSSPRLKSSGAQKRKSTSDSATRGSFARRLSMNTASDALQGEEGQTKVSVSAPDPQAVEAQATTSLGSAANSKLNLPLQNSKQMTKTLRSSPRLKRRTNSSDSSSGSPPKRLDVESLSEALQEEQARSTQHSPMSKRRRVSVEGKSDGVPSAKTVLAIVEQYDNSTQEYSEKKKAVRRRKPVKAAPVNTTAAAPAPTPKAKRKSAGNDDEDAPKPKRRYRRKTTNTEKISGATGAKEVVAVKNAGRVAKQKSRKLRKKPKDSGAAGSTGAPVRRMIVAKPNESDVSSFSSFQSQNAEAETLIELPHGRKVTHAAVKFSKNATQSPTKDPMHSSNLGNTDSELKNAPKVSENPPTRSISAPSSESLSNSTTEGASSERTCDARENVSTELSGGSADTRSRFSGIYTNRASNKSSSGTAVGSILSENLENATHAQDDDKVDKECSESETLESESEIEHPSNSAKLRHESHGSPLELSRAVSDPAEVGVRSVSTSRARSPDIAAQMVTGNFFKKFRIAKDELEKRNKEVAFLRKDLESLSVRCIKLRVCVFGHVTCDVGFGGGRSVVGVDESSEFSAYFYTLVTRDFLHETRADESGAREEKYGRCFLRKIELNVRIFKYCAFVSFFSGAAWIQVARGMPDVCLQT